MRLNEPEYYLDITSETAEHVDEYDRRYRVVNCLGCFNMERQKCSHAHPIHP